MQAVSTDVPTTPRKPRRGNSIVVMLVISFVLVLLPLVVAIGIAAVNVSRLSDEAAEALGRSTFLATRSKALDRDVLEMERNIRQAAQLGPQAESFALLVEAFEARHERVQRMLATLLTQARDPEGRRQLEMLRTRIRSMAEQFTVDPQSPDKLDQVRELGDLTDRWIAYTEELYAAESQRVREAAENTRETLKRLIIAAIPTALGLIALFTFLITRSLRQISRAINQLGDNEFDRQIDVRGPADLRTLGDELETLRRRLRQAERQKQRFLRHMSHELKTPLASLLEGTELFVDGSLGDLPTAQSEVAGILRSNAQELRHLIENLLDYSAWQSHGGVLRCTEFDLEVLCEQVLDQYRLMLRTRKIRIDQRVVPMRLLADRDKLRTVLSNLVSNAVKYTPADGTLYLRAFAAQGSLMLDLADSGPNIAREERAHIFEPFFTGTPPQQAHLNGSGIGLSLVSEYVRAHGGTVTLMDGTYSGAHFRILMPMQAQSGPVRLSA
jgi:two-component system sensor histidine kinase GlrK